MQELRKLFLLEYPDDIREKSSSLSAIDLYKHFLEGISLLSISNYDTLRCEHVTFIILNYKQTLELFLTPIMFIHIWPLNMQNIKNI